MLFKKNHFLHQWHKNKYLNLFEKRFIFASQSNTAEVQSNDHNLPGEYVQGQDILENRARKIDNEMVTRKKRGKTKRILAGIFKKDEESNDELKFKKEVCGTKLDLLKKPIQSNEDFSIALEDIGSFNRSLSILRSSDLDHAALADLVSSGLGSFFSSRLSKRLESATGSMKAREVLNNLLLQGKAKPEFAKQARDDWKEHEALLKEQLKKAKSRDIVNLEEVRDIEADLKNQTNWVNQRIAELEAQQKIEAENNDNLEFLNTDEGRKLQTDDPDLYELIKQQATKGEIDELRLRRYVRQAEAEQQKIDVSSFLNHEDKLEINGILLEAREMREVQIRIHLENQFKAVSAKISKVQEKEPPRFSESELREFEEIFGFFESGLLKKTQLLREGGTIEIPSYNGVTETMACGPNVAKQLLDGLQLASATIDGSDERYDDFLDEVNKDPEYFKDQIHQKFKSLEEATAAFTPERIDELLAKLEGPEFKSRSDYKERKEGLLALKGNDNVLNQAMNETRAQVANLDNLSLSELSGIFGSLNDMERMLFSFSGKQIDTALNPNRIKEIGRAKIILREVAKLENPIEIRQVLEKNLDEKNLDFVSADEFENYPDPVTGNTKNLKDYTSEGGMVFYESADKKDWRIIIRWPVDESDKESFKEQILHETRHMLFEKDPKIQEKWNKACIKNPKWQDIKNSFIAALQPKKPPEGDAWLDKHVLSEMYDLT